MLDKNPATGLFSQVIDFTKSYNFELATLWDINDIHKVARHYDRMTWYAKAIKSAFNTRNFSLFDRLRKEKSMLEEKFDEKLVRFYEDQKSSLSFNDNGIRDFEPIMVTPKKNTVLLKGLSVLLSYFAFETNATVMGYSIGIGTDPVYPFQDSLTNEIDRTYITEGGKSSTGNYLRYSIQWSPNLPNNTYSEFGLELYMDSPPALARTVIDEYSKRLKHEQGNTFVMASHYIVFVPV